MHNIVSKNLYHLTPLQRSLRNVLEAMVPPYSTVINHLFYNACKADDDNVSMENEFPYATAQQKPAFLGKKWNIWNVKCMPYSQFRDRYTSRVQCGVIWKEGWKKTYKAFIHALYKLLSSCYQIQHLTSM